MAQINRFITSLKCVYRFHIFFPGFFLIIFFFVSTQVNRLSAQEEPVYDPQGVRLISKKTNIVVLDFFNLYDQPEAQTLNSQISQSIRDELDRAKHFTIYPADKLRDIIAQSGYSLHYLYSITRLVRLGQLLETELVVAGKYKVEERENKKSLNVEVTVCTTDLNPNDYFTFQEVGPLEDQTDATLSGIAVELTAKILARFPDKFPKNPQIRSIVLEAVALKPADDQPELSRYLTDKVRSVIKKDPSIFLMSAPIVHKIVAWKGWNAIECSEPHVFFDLGNRLLTECVIVIQYSKSSRGYNLFISAYDMERKTRIFTLDKQRINEDEFDSWFQTMGSQLTQPIVSLYKNWDPGRFNRSMSSSTESETNGAELPDYYLFQKPNLPSHEPKRRH